MFRIVGVCSALGLISLSALGQTAPSYQDVSARLTADGQSLIATAPADARLLFERALVANPANVAALIGLGRSFDAEDKPGRSLKFYRHALELEPDNRSALVQQAKAFLKRDLLYRAEANLARLDEICDRCDEAVDIEESISVYKAQKASASEAEDEAQG